MTYEDFKNVLETHKTKIFLALSFVLIFMAGYGTGRYQKNQNPKRYGPSNYTKNQTTTQNTKVEEEGGGVKGVSTSTTTSTVQAADCFIKGNISTGGKKIYHMPGGASYKIVKPEMCFKTEDEAKNAGFIKSGR